MFWQVMRTVGTAWPAPHSTTTSAAHSSSESIQAVIRRIWLSVRAESQPQSPNMRMFGRAAPRSAGTTVRMKRPHRLGSILDFEWLCRKDLRAAFAGALHSTKAVNLDDPLRGKAGPLELAVDIGGENEALPGSSGWPSGEGSRTPHGEWFADRAPSGARRNPRPKWILGKPARVGQGDEIEPEPLIGERPPEPFFTAEVGQSAVDPHAGPAPIKTRIGRRDRLRGAVKGMVDHRASLASGSYVGVVSSVNRPENVTSTSGELEGGNSALAPLPSPATRPELHHFLVQTAVRSSEACSRMPLSERISSVALSASWWLKTIVSEDLSSKRIVVNFCFESRSTSTKWRRFLIGTPLTSLTTLVSGLSYPLPILWGNIGEVTTTSSSPSNLGRSPRRVASGLPIIASAA